MIKRAVSAPVAPGLQGALERWPTGAKIVIIISLALLPLALIGMLATLQSSRTAANENRARLRFAAEESARTLGRELTGDMDAMRVAMAALDADPGNLMSCARLAAVFADQTRAGARFVILGAQGQLLCGDRFAGAASPRRGRGPDAIEAMLRPGEGLLLRVGDGRGHAEASALFPTAFVAGLGRPVGFSLAYGARLTDGAGSVALAVMPDTIGLSGRETFVAPVGIDRLALEMQARGARITSPIVVAFVLPVLMWVAAVAIAWFVIDRLLIAPLRRLRSSVASYRPGDLISLDKTGPLPAQEIRELGETFRAISRTVAIHEAGLAEGLVRQTRLTKEVHHRVKNNLQVISSLINIHARAAHGDGATEAYASIQRRVDALAVVHRNHFADAEVNRGLPLRSMLSELAGNIRAMAPDDRAQLAITLDVDPFLVNQDVAVAIAFLVTEAIELAMTVDRAPRIRVSVKRQCEGRASLRVASTAFAEGEPLRLALAQRYGRVMEGLARQLRAKLSHDAAEGAYEITVPANDPD